MLLEMDSMDYEDESSDSVDPMQPVVQLERLPADLVTKYLRKSVDNVVFKAIPQPVPRPARTSSRNANLSFKDFIQLDVTCEDPSFDEDTDFSDPRGGKDGKKGKYKTAGDKKELRDYLCASNELVKYEIDTASDLKSYRCAICNDFSAEKKAFIVRHLCYAHTLTEIFSSYRIRDDPSAKDYYQCDQCEYKTGGTRALVRFFLTHMMSHTEEYQSFENGLYRCRECSEHFDSNKKLRDHIKKHTKPFLCSYCGESFRDRRLLQSHIMDHNQDTLFKCDHCEYSCKQLKSLKEHMRKHTGEFLRCPFANCDFRTAYISALTLHKQRHSDRKKYICDVCAYATNDSGSYKKHVDMHTGIKRFKCPDCQYRAVSHDAVAKHMRKHSSERVYKCSVCNYETAYGSGLRVHMMVHEDVKPFKCDQCAYSSVSKAKVKRHILTRHEGTGRIIDTGLRLSMNSGDFRTAPRKARPKRVEELRKPVKLTDEEVDYYDRLDAENKFETGIIEHGVQTLSDDADATSALLLLNATMYACGQCNFVSNSLEEVQKHQETCGIRGIPGSSDVIEETMEENIIETIEEIPDGANIVLVDNIDMGQQTEQLKSGDKSVKVAFHNETGVVPSESLDAE